MEGEVDRILKDLHVELGRKTLNRSWAKGEIVLGLLAVGVALLVFNLCANQTNVDSVSYYAGAGILLFVLGGYLTLAGHRSHLYQSNNELAAWFVMRMTSARTRSIELKKVENSEQ